MTRRQLFAMMAADSLTASPYSVTPSGVTFTDSIPEYGAHVYQITEGAAGSPLLKKCILCKGVKVQ